MLRIFVLFLVIVSLSFGALYWKNRQDEYALQDVEGAYIERDSPFDNRDPDPNNVNAQQPRVIFHGPRDQKKLALTFDAEMTDGMKWKVSQNKNAVSYDKRIIDTLLSTNTKATLFLTGMWAELYPSYTTQLSKNPLFEIASHSYADTSFHGYCYGLKQISKTQAKEDIQKTQTLLEKLTGRRPKFFRFPGGCYSQDDLMMVTKEGLTVVHWDVKGVDGFNWNAGLVESNVVDNAQNGSIIILHLNGEPTAPKTAQSLPNIIKRLKEKGFEFVTVSELLNL